MSGGFLGFEVFFVLSGFIIAYNYADRFRRFARGSYRTFLWARVARIYPVHLVTLAVMGALVLEPVGEPCSSCWDSGWRVAIWSRGRVVA